MNLADTHALVKEAMLGTAAGSELVDGMLRDAGLDPEEAVTVVRDAVLSYMERPALNLDHPLPVHLSAMAVYMLLVGAHYARQS